MAALPKHIVVNRNTREIFIVTKQIGMGTYGKVLFGTELHTNKPVALKVMEQDLCDFAAYEIQNLMQLRSLDPDKCNLVKFYESFIYKDFIYIVMEMLDRSLHDYVNEKENERLELSDIRVILKQTLVALNALKSIGLVHTDLKPDNIMLCDHRKQPFKIKLIDFGLALKESNIEQGVQMQPTGYRAPEVILGLPANAAVDMWSVGCIGALLYIYNHLYPIWCEYEEIKLIVQMHGQPEDRMLEKGLHSEKFFWKIREGNKYKWKLKTKLEYNETNNMEHETNNMEHETNNMEHVAQTSLSSKYTCLEDMMDDHPVPATELEWGDTWAFLDLIKRMLCVDPAKRIKPPDALEHNFINMTHFPSDAADHPYVKASYKSMIMCTTMETDEGSNDTEPTLSAPGAAATVETKDEEEVEREETNQSKPEDLNSDSDAKEITKTSMTLMTRIRNFFYKKKSKSGNETNKTSPGDKANQSSPGGEPSQSKSEDTNQSSIEDKPIKSSTGKPEVTSDGIAENVDLLTAKTQKELLKRIGNFFSGRLSSRPGNKTNKSSPGDNPDQSNSGKELHQSNFGEESNLSKPDDSPNTSKSGIKECNSDSELENLSFECDKIQKAVLMRIESFFSRRCFSISSPEEEPDQSYPAEEPNKSNPGDKPNTSKASEKEFIASSDQENVSSECDKTKKLLLKRIGNFFSWRSSSRHGQKAKKSSPADKSNQSNSADMSNESKASVKEVFPGSDAEDMGFVTVTTRKALLRRMGSFLSKKLGFRPGN